LGAEAVVVLKGTTDAFAVARIEKLGYLLDELLAFVWEFQGLKRLMRGGQTSKQLADENVVSGFGESASSFGVFGLVEGHIRVAELVLEVGDGLQIKTQIHRDNASEKVNLS
jgi:hypothetical protein